MFCKVSGLVTEADWRTGPSTSSRIYWEVILDAFGPKRMMFGSDWPVCLLAASYGSWYELCRRFTLAFPMKNETASSAARRSKRIN